MHAISENMKPDNTAGKWFTAMVPPFPIMLDALNYSRDVCICLHLGNRAKTVWQGMIVEAVVPSLETFCTQLGFQVKDVVWRYREGVAEETRSERSVVGFPNRLLPASWRARALSLAVPAEHRKGAIDHIQFALWRVQEDRVNRMFAPSESLLIAAITPAAGWLIDLFGSVDLVLVIAGLFFVLLLALSLLVSGLICSMHHHRSQVPWHTSGGLVGNSCWACSGKAWLTS